MLKILDCYLKPLKMRYVLFFVSEYLEVTGMLAMKLQT
jgi:hypothetical protein